MTLRRTVLAVALLNLAYFVVEFHFGRVYQSVALIGDSIDFLEDASVNILIALAIGWTLATRQYVGYLLALLLLVPGVAFLRNAVEQVADLETPVGSGMSAVALGALLVNVFCALLIARHRTEQGGLVTAAYFSARNDALTNLLVIAAGLVTLRYPSIWPDLLVGIAILVLNADAARAVLRASKGEVQAHRA